MGKILNMEDRHNYINHKIKKETEQEVLEYFLDAYKYVTGELIEIIDADERPDFICTRENGNSVGIEIFMVRRGHPNDILFELLVSNQENMSIDQALMTIPIKPPS